MEIRVSPFIIAAYPTLAQEFTIDAKATGDGAADAFVEIFGPSDTYASGTGSATLSYQVTPADFGTKVEFSASATDRDDVIAEGYVIQAVLEKMVFSKPEVVCAKVLGNPETWRIFLSDDPDDPTSAAGFSIECAFRVEPLVPGIPGLGYFQVNPFKFRVRQWVDGNNTTKIANLPEHIDHKYAVEDVDPTDPPVSAWNPETQQQTFLVGDDPGVSLQAPLRIIEQLAKYGDVNVFLEVKYDVFPFQSIANGHWTIAMHVDPQTTVPPNSVPDGNFVPTDGVASDKQMSPPQE